MNFKSLTAFTLVMELGSITAAADKLRLSPPAVSRLISQLESETGLKLFNRTHRGLVPTEAAHLFVKEAQRILSDLDELPEVIKRIKHGAFQNLSILTTPRLAPGLIVPALAAFAQRFPQVKCTLDVQPKWDVERSLIKSRYDICIAILPVPNGSLVVRPLYRILLEVLMPHSHRLAKAKYVTARDLQKERVIGFLPGQVIRHQLNDWLSELGMNFEFSIQTSNATIAADLTRRGCGLTVVDRLFYNGMCLDGLKTRPIHPDIWTTVGVLFARDDPPGELAQEYMNCVRQVLTDFAHAGDNAAAIELFPEESAGRVRL